ncbi:MULTISPECIES: hypothetical protein [Bacillus cereus group]|uniref:Uncharacterized protein n=1 Tax=Bacillus thuringiensis TaxID=1428 RepID=A0A9X7AG58_BACTU|nr:hypothetical protein [Bacillus thuringiensis]MCQ6337984.1 hypothetical protein [Bacillus cereus]PFT30907.1 hypothetical protein COK72_32495 [Bacillus thuringiensis]
MKVIQKCVGIILTGVICFSSLLFFDKHTSSAETKFQHTKEYNEVSIVLDSHTWYMLSGRSVDIIFGDINAVILKGNNIKFTKPGTYTIKVNGCVYDDIFTFQVNK